VAASAEALAQVIRATTVVLHSTACSTFAMDKTDIPRIGMKLASKLKGTKKASSLLILILMRVLRVIGLRNSMSSLRNLRIRNLIIPTLKDQSTVKILS